MRKEQEGNAGSRKEKATVLLVASDELCPSCGEEFELSASAQSVELECRCGCSLAVA